jgi:hypothetical protein
MKIKELLEDLPNTPGIMAIPVMPSITKPTAGNVTATANSIGQANTNGNVTAQNTTALTAAKQKLNTGMTMTVPDGMSKTPTQFQIISKNPTNKTVTIKNPRKPNDPMLTYPEDTVTNWLIPQK